MKRRKVLWFAVAFLGLAAVLGASNYWSIAGWLRQESFYDGRPTSYWEWELEYWEYHGRWSGSLRNLAVPLPKEAYRYSGYRKENSMEKFLSKIGFRMPLQAYTNPLMEGDPAAEQVLRELQSSSSKHVARLAEIGLVQIRKKAAQAPGD